MIQFSSKIGWWSPAIFWYVLVNLVLCVGFSVVVLIGGLFDLRFLLKALEEQEPDAADDGRVLTPPSEESSIGEAAPPPRTARESGRPSPTNRSG